MPTSRVPFPTRAAGDAGDFRALLHGELARRRAGNPRYSLRAFALALAVDHATLSQLLRGRRALTPRTIRRLAARLGLPAEAAEAYVAAEAGRTARPPRDAHDRSPRRLLQDAAEALSSWHHAALLQLVRHDGFRPDVAWIARALGLGADDVARALACLCRLQLLRLDGPRWIDTSADAAVRFEDVAHAALERAPARGPAPSPPSLLRSHRWPAP